MANFVAILDPDKQRRVTCLHHVSQQIAPCIGLRVGRAAAGDLSVVWAAHPDAPVSVKADSDDGAALVWGRPIHDDTDAYVTAGELDNAWPVADKSASPTLLNGYFAALNYSAADGLVAGADLLGIFPLYYWWSKDILLLGSSPRLFKAHPRFRAEFNPHALAGILLTVHLADASTLWKGVRRLKPGHLLRWGLHGEPTEVEQFRLPASTCHFDLPFSVQVELLNESIERAVRRHVEPDTPQTLFLSGGLDSRMLGGYLKRNGLPADGFTMGHPHDTELKCAKQVAAALGIRLNISELDMSAFSVFADMQVTWEHLANGFNTIHTWGIPDLIRPLAPRAVTGYMLDAVVGTHYMTWGYSQATRQMSFDQFFQNLNEYGLAPEMLHKILNPDCFGNSVADIMALLRTRYESYSELHTQRAWCFNLAHRQRFHVGPILWRISFGAWPTVPVLDRQLLECAGGMPAATIAERRAQKALLCRQFPDLARIPLDRNSADVAALQPRLRHLLAQHVRAHMRPVRRLKHRLLPNNRERRRYFRIYDFNGPHWRTVRQAAEAGRERALAYFNEDAFNELLPPPHADVNCERAIIRTSGLKLLTGFMLWVADQD